MATITKRLTQSDMKLAALIHRMSFDERLPWLAGLHTPSEDCTFFHDVVFNRCDVWGCFENEHLLGFIAFREPLIEHLYVVPVHQGRGLGTALLSIAQDHCRELELWTFQRNGLARRFYERKGFTAIETTDGAHNDENEPDVRYRWQAR